MKRARKPKPSLEPMLPLAEVARILACSERTITRRIAARLFFPSPINDHGRWLIPQSAVESYIERRRIAA